MNEQELSRLAEIFVRGFNALDRDEQRLARALYRALSRGRPVSPSELAEEASMPASSVAKTLRAWPDIHWTEDGSIRAYLGLSVEPTRHRIEFDAGTAYTWCAWDTLFIPGVAGLEARVRSTCPASGAEVSLAVGPRGVEQDGPDDLGLSFVEPAQSELGESVTKDFCQYVHFVSTGHPETAAWLEARPGLFLLSVDEGFELGRRVNAERFASGS